MYLHRGWVLTSIQLEEIQHVLQGWKNTFLLFFLQYLASLKKKHRQNMFLLRLLMVLLAGNSVHPGAMRFSLLSRYVNVCLPTLLITSPLNFVKKCLNPHTVENCVHCILQRASELFVISLWAWSKPFKFNWQTSVNAGWFEQHMIWKLTVLLSRNPEHTEINHLDH